MKFWSFFHHFDSDSDFTDFYRVLPSFTEFYLVLPSFTVFYRVPRDPLLSSFNLSPSQSTCYSSVTRNVIELSAVVTSGTGFPSATTRNYAMPFIDEPVAVVDVVVVVVVVATHPMTDEFDYVNINRNGTVFIFHPRVFHRETSPKCRKENASLRIKKMWLNPIKTDETKVKQGKGAMD